MMAVKLKSKIVGYKVKSADDVKVESVAENSVADVIQMHEKVERPEMLVGSTYKNQNTSLRACAVCHDQ